MTSSLTDHSNSGAISQSEFNIIRRMIYEEAGISLSDAKKTLVCSRLSKRLRHLALSSFSEYIRYLSENDREGTERQIMVNCLTTNKTDFFREPHHFDFLRDVVLPQLQSAALEGAPRRLRIWSAACSTGEEPYTIAMTILESLRSLRAWDVEIVASDINTEVLAKAKSGIYSLDRISGIDPVLKEKYFLRGKGRFHGCCQLIDAVKNLVKFQQVNFLDERWPIHGEFDVIFCRNVLIYFDTPTQQRLLPRIVEKLKDGGHLMLGHSENLPWLAETLTPLGRTMHQKEAGHGGHSPRTNATTKGRKGNSVRETSPLGASAVSGNASQSLRSSRTAKQRMRTDRDAEGLTKEPAFVRKKELHPGDLFATDKPTEIFTTLGSCVAACLFDPVAKVGGMNHFLLPVHSSDPAVCGRYGVHAMEMLISEITNLGGDRKRLRAKVFGGSTLLTGANERPNVGMINSQFVRQFLKTEDIPIDAEKLEGTEPLRIHFIPTTGTVYAKRIQQSESMIDREQRLSQQLITELDRFDSSPRNLLR